MHSYSLDIGIHSSSDGRFSDIVQFIICFIYFWQRAQGY